MLGDEPVLVAVGIGRPSVLADRQGVDESRVRRAFHRLEQRGEKRGQLVACVVEAAYLAEVDRKLVEPNQGRLAAEQLAQGLGAGCDAALVARTDSFKAGRPREGIGNLTPWGMGQHAVAHRSSVGRVGVLAIEGGDPDIARRECGGLYELRDVRYSFQAIGRVSECNQPVGLAAAVGRIEAEDGRDLAACPRKPPAHVGEQVLEPPRGVGVGEETNRVEVVGARPAAYDRGEARDKVGFGNRSGKDVLPRPAGLEDRGDGDVACFSRLAGPSSRGSRARFTGQGERRAASRTGTLSPAAFRWLPSSMELPESNGRIRRRTSPGAPSRRKRKRRRAQASRVRSSRRMILPVLVFGTSSTNCIARGTL